MIQIGHGLVCTDRLNDFAAVTFVLDAGYIKGGDFVVVGCCEFSFYHVFNKWLQFIGLCRNKFYVRKFGIFESKAFASG